MRWFIGSSSKPATCPPRLLRSFPMWRRCLIILMSTPTTGQELGLISKRPCSPYSILSWWRIRNSGRRLSYSCRGRFIKFNRKNKLRICWNLPRNPSWMSPRYLPFPVSNCLRSLNSWCSPCWKIITLRFKFKSTVWVNTWIASLIKSKYWKVKIRYFPTHWTPATLPSLNSKNKLFYSTKKSTNFKDRKPTFQKSPEPLNMNHNSTTTSTK